jgi:hypothetical protein
LHIGEDPVGLSEIHDITDVYMTAIHTTFAGRAIDGRALVGALIGGALGVLRELEVEDPKSVALDLINAIDLTEIMPFTPAKH